MIPLLRLPLPSPDYTVWYAVSEDWSGGGRNPPLWLISPYNLTHHHHRPRHSQNHSPVMFSLLSPPFFFNQNLSNRKIESLIFSLREDIRSHTLTHHLLSPRIPPTLFLISSTPPNSLLSHYFHTALSLALTLGSANFTLINSQHPCEAAKPNAQKRTTDIIFYIYWKCL